MMMTTEELKERLEKIDKKLELIVYKGEPHLLYLVDGRAGNPMIYDFTSQKRNGRNCLIYIPDKIHDLNKLLDEYYEGRNEILARDSEDSVDSTDPETQLKGHTAKEMGETAREVAENWKKFDTRIAGSLSEENPFKDYTNHLAKTLQEKNNAYGDSFTKSIDEDGLLVLKIRLGDKFNRVSSLIKRGELKENDESLEDTLLDLAGYSILGLKYLEEHKN